MRRLTFFILAVISCAMLVACGCTSPAGTRSPGVAAETTAAITADAPMAKTTTAAEIPSWTGTWNTSYSVKDSADTVEIITMTQDGMSVTGTYHNGLGTIDATVQDNKITGTWHDSDDAGEYSGFFVFEKSADDKSFSGVWVSTEEGAGALETTAQYWNGARE